MSLGGAPGPILFLDSGVGGLSVLREVRALRPDAPLVYCADSAGFPYGARTEAEISARVAGLLGRLAERVRPSLIVIACNTASTIALAHVRGVLGDVPIVGTVPAIKPAAAISRSRVIGVLGTAATVRQPYVDDLALRFAADCRILRHAAPLLVDVAEAKLRGEALDMAVVEQALDGLRIQTDGQAMDSVVLACTHFPLLLPELEEASLALEVAGRLHFIDGAQGIGRRVAHLLEGVAWSADVAPGRFIVTGSVEELAPLAAALHGFGLTQMERL
jgi:glutamate racemase